jgi:hypothetical protein
MVEVSSERIRELNDQFRITLDDKLGVVMKTAGVAALPPIIQGMALSKVRFCTTFTEDNDPNGEHDFGSFDIAEEKFFWKIDYYNLTMDGGSEDPADPKKTKRVLTIMLASEY